MWTYGLHGRRGAAVSLRWPTISEAWAYGDPSNIADRMRARSRRSAARGEAISLRVVLHTARDRYYTQARRLVIQKLCRGK